MKMSKEVVDGRRKYVMKIIQSQGSATVDELSDRLKVSPVTIRRDLLYWESMGAIRRFYGGAKLIQNFVDMDIPELSNEVAKNAIANYAAQCIKDNDTIFINTGSTALLIIKYIKNKHVTIITNNGKALYVDHDPLVTICLTGGELRLPKDSMVGDFALNNLNRVSANKTFLGCSGISSKSGMTTAIFPEVPINETMISRCMGPVFIVADHTKIGADHSFVSGDIHKIDYLITDDRADLDVLEDLQQEGVKIHTVKAL